MFDIGPNNLTPTCTAYLLALRQMCGEEVHAYSWLEGLIKVALVWDHLVDNDPVNHGALDEVMVIMITEWPRNPFLRKYGDYLMPTCAASISAWRYNTSRDLHYSVYREIPCAVAFLIGGNPLVEKTMPNLSSLVRKMKEEDDQRDGQAS